MIEQEQLLQSNNDREVVEQKDNAIYDNHLIINHFCIEKDTLVKIDEQEWYEKISISEIKNKFISHNYWDEHGKQTVEIHDNKIDIMINMEKYIFTKDDIHDIDTDFVQQSIFQNIFFKEISLQKSVFEIFFGVPDTDNIIIIYLSINNKGEKSIKIEYPEDEY
jgi:hypothetical protein